MMVATGPVCVAAVFIAKAYAMQKFLYEMLIFGKLSTSVRPCPMGTATIILEYRQTCAVSIVSRSGGACAEPVDQAAVKKI